MTAEAALLDAIAIDPRPCEQCGLTLDEHFTVDGAEGPKLFCQPLDAVVHLSAIRLQEAWERADPRDRWTHTGEPRPPDSIRNGPQGEPCRPSRRLAQSTVDAFMHLVRHDRERLPAWLDSHRRDAPELLRIWKDRTS